MTSLNHLNRRLLVTTLTELSAIARAASIGFNRIPNGGYKMPAASGIKTTL